MELFYCNEAVWFSSPTQLIFERQLLAPGTLFLSQSVLCLFPGASVAQQSIRFYQYSHDWLS